jgi:hypothetical protein
MSSKKTKSKSKLKKSKSARARKKTAGNKRAVKSTKSGKSLARKAAPKKMASKKRTFRKKRASVNVEREIQQDFRGRNLAAAGIASAGRSGDLQGLSRSAQADSESVDELVEEGNVFEAGAVAGVEQADDADEREVHTHEVPEDDVPDEYLEKD